MFRFRSFFIKSGIDNPLILIIRNIISHDKTHSKWILIPHRLSGDKDPPNVIWNVGSWDFVRRASQEGEMEENASQHVKECLFSPILRGSASEKGIRMVVWLKIQTFVYEKLNFGKMPNVMILFWFQSFFVKSGIDNPLILILRNIISHGEIRSKLRLKPHRLSGHKDPPNVMWNVGSWDFVRRASQEGEMEENASQHV